MAEINIEQKKKSSLWTWLLPLLLAVALTVWFLNRGRDNVTEGAVVDSAAVGAGGANAPGSPR